ARDMPNQAIRVGFLDQRVMQSRWQGAVGEFREGTRECGFTVDGCLNPRLSGAGSKIGGATANPAPSLLPKPFIPGHRTDGGQQGLDGSPLSGPSAAEGGGRRPAFTVVCRPATIDAED